MLESVDVICWVTSGCLEKVSDHSMSMHDKDSATWDSAAEILGISVWRVVTLNLGGQMLRFFCFGLFLPARRYASAGLCDSDVSVCLSLRPSVSHTPVLCLAERKQDREMYTI